MKKTSHFEKKTVSHFFKNSGHSETKLGQIYSAERLAENGFSDTNKSRVKKKMGATKRTGHN